jgi:hypothetical protein
MTRIRDKKVRESIEYFQQCMTRVRDNSVMEGKGSNKYLQQFMTRIRDNKVRGTAQGYRFLESQDLCTPTWTLQKTPLKPTGIPLPLHGQGFPIE